MDVESLKAEAGISACSYVKSGMKVGLGTGSTAAWLVKCLGEMVEKEGKGAIIYINRSSNGGGLLEELRVFEKNRTSDEVKAAPMDSKDYGTGAQIIRHLGIRKLNVLTDTDRPIGNIGYGLEISKLSPLT